ncbi:hypothetical protein NDA11_003359 [Ustilago hordei]|nr:hypothetical protein NDA11_003359 [Ustilago hordei]
MGSWNRPVTAATHPLFGLFPQPSSVPIQAYLGIGALLAILLALIAYRDMLKPGLQAASRLHSYTHPASASSTPVRRARSAAASASSSSSSTTTTSAPPTNPKYKGLRNTGNTCFFNSTLQSISSLTLFRRYLYLLVEQAERWDTPTPVIDALLELVEELAAPGDRNSAINPTQLVRALQNLPSSSIRSLVGAHQQQDAHELFALLNDAVDREAKAIQYERSNALESEQAGLRALMAPSLPWNGRGVYAQVKGSLPLSQSNNPLQALAIAHGAEDAESVNARQAANADNTFMISPFDALLAQRTICLDCGYCEAIRHFSTSEISLSVPPINVATHTSDITGTSACSLQECLELWSDLEQVDWICWNCTLRSTLLSVKSDLAVKRPSPATTKQNGRAANDDANGLADGNLTPAKKKRMAQLRSKETKLTRIIESGLSEDELKQASDDPSSPWHNILTNIQLKKTLSRLSTKQIMISRPPRILALHLNRSSYAAAAWAPAKNNRHVLFPEYLDLSHVTLQGSISLDGRQTMNSAIFQPGTAKQVEDGKAESVYKLAAIVVHYGSHSFGHYIAFKRVPGAQSHFNRIGDEGPSDTWLRISDDSVSRVSIQQVKQENPYMLFYELLPPSSADAAPQHKLELPGGADYATLQKAIARAVAVNGDAAKSLGGERQAGYAICSSASSVPSSWRVRPRTVHRWSTPSFG